jgi:hypothetical protein
MLANIDLVRLTIEERHRDADRGRLVALARRVASCCAPATLRTRIVTAIRGTAAKGCPPDEALGGPAIRLATGC